MATLLMRELGRRRSSPLLWTAVLPPTILAMVVVLLIGLGLSDGSTPASDRLSSASDVVVSAAAAISAATYAPSAEGVAFGPSDDCDDLGISGDLVGEQASPHEVFKASLDLCRAK
jgi:hypothetical protein